MPKLTEPGDIIDFSISSNSKNFSIDISPSVVEFRYFESVLSNTVTATAAVIDTGVQADSKIGEGSIIDALPIRGGERVDISVVDNYGEEVSLVLFVNRVRNANPGTSQEVFFIDFSSGEYFANEQFRVTKRYKDAPISTHVSDISKAMGITEIDIDDTAGNYNFYGNDRKPFYILTWLASKSIPSSSGQGTGLGGAAGFMFYQTKDGHFFKSIDNLLDQDAKKTYVYTGSIGLPDDEDYDGKIVSYNIKADIDVQQNLALGVYNNRTIFFDPLSFSYVVQGFNVDQQESKITTAGDKEATAARLLNPELLQTPSRLMSRVLDVGFNQPGSGDEQIKQVREGVQSKPNDKTTMNLVQSVMRYNQLFTIQTEIKVPGDFSLRAGDIVKCVFPQIGPEDTSGPINNETSGEYLVAHVCHRTTPKDTYSSLTLVRDSYRTKND
tara:strand:+ start:1552 stop:2871 length:1320 start_codon:yes stop_codon:yes gene_type:complete